MIQHPCNKINKDLINNAVSDKYSWIYVSVNTGHCIFKLNRNEIVYEVEEVDEVDSSNICLIQVLNVYRWINNTWVKSWLWLHSIGLVYKLEDAMIYTWGANIIRDFHNFIFRRALLKIFINRYLKYIRHITWEPDSIHVKKLKEQFIKNSLLLQTLKNNI